MIIYFSINNDENIVIRVVLWTSKQTCRKLNIHHENGIAERRFPSYSKLEYISLMIQLTRNSYP